MKLTIALIGNQNCGKTTLFNQLTGSNQHVGNFPGVTVEKKSGAIKKQFVHPESQTGKQLEVELVDLPGIYSLSPYTSEERVTRDFLINEKPDAVINILDATNVERNLYLSLQLMEMQIPMVLALNMMDEVRKAGNSIDIARLSDLLHLDIVPIAASKAEGVSELAQVAIENALCASRPHRIDFCAEDSPVHRAIHAIAHLIQDHAERYGIPVRFAATKLVEGDAPVLEKLELDANETDILGHITDDMEKELGTDREAALADMRYDFIARLSAAAVHRVGDTKEQQRSVRIDSVLTNRVLAIPFFLGIMSLIFWLTFSVIGGTLSDLLSVGIDAAVLLTDRALAAVGISPVIHSLVIDGICAGVGSVLSFMPIILVLFFFLSLLEDSGYMARVAFVMDSFLRKIGLSGKSFVPMLLGFGCSVPAIMATRTLSSRRDRRLTVFITPFMSCSAKLPVYALFAASFFPGYEVPVMICLYIGGMVVAVLGALLLKQTLFRGKPVPFVMELPAYRLPSCRSMALLIREKALDFLRKAFTVIFGATIVIWFLQTFDIRLNMVADSASSILALIGTAIAPVFYPLGFSDWRLSTALLTGLTAKEAVVSTLAVLTGASADGAGTEALQSVLAAMMTPAAAAAFLTFTLLYMPCVAALAVTRREIGNRYAVLAAVFQTASAWIAGVLVYTVASLFV